MALMLIGTSSILGAINFLVTIFKMRAPGMTLFRMPILVWTVLVTSVLVLMATPVITSALIMLFIDRNYGGSFFDPSRRRQRDPLPEHLLVLLAPGRLRHGPAGDGHHQRDPAGLQPQAAVRLQGVRLRDGRRSAPSGFSVWAHHMFTTGAVFLPFFSLMTFLIAVPTGVKMFNWIFTMWRGQLMLKTPLLFALGFLTMFLIGGINGAFSASVPVDFALHDTYWVVAHLHYVLFGGSVFGVIAGDLLLVPEDDRPDAERDPRQGPVRADVHRLQPDVLPDARARASPGMPRRIADYSVDRRLERPEPRSRRSAASSIAA